MSLFKKILNKDVSKQIAKTTEIGKTNQKKFSLGLTKSSNFFKNAINDVIRSNNKIDENLYDDISDMLLSFDIGTVSCQKITNAITEEIELQNITNVNDISQIIIDQLFLYYIQGSIIDNSLNIKESETNIILVSGVNGVGKTTSIAKLANYLLADGKTVCVVAGDTFRAGAIEQLNVWAERLNIPIFKPDSPNQDPASVIFNGVKYASENKIDVVLCDTSGRLQSKANLMNELSKINKIIKKFNESQPCDSLLVLDATTGQSGLAQAKAFSEVTDITGIILTKMDSTSRGGIAIAIKDTFDLPVKFIGLGEKIDDLQPFDLEKFVNGMVNQ